MRSIPVYYSDDVLAESDSRSPSARKPKPVVEAWKSARLAIELRPVVPATVADLCLAHDPSFVSAILECRMPNGFGNDREDVARSLPFTCGAMIGAAIAVLESGVACAPVSGFHHAGYANASMFCTFNGLMVAAAGLLRTGRAKRIMVLDCDFHYGNGTDEIIVQLGLGESVENMTFGRWHRDPSKAKVYLEELGRAAGRFGDFDLIIYQAGADLHVDDPLGGVLDSAQMRQRDRMVFEAAKRANVPLAWNLAGGYQIPISKVIALHTATMEECVRTYVA